MPNLSRNAHAGDAQVHSIASKSRTPRQSDAPALPSGSRAAAQENANRSGKTPFAVRCEPLLRPTALVASHNLSAFVSQRIRRNNVEQSWDSLLIYCEEEPDGTLAVRVLVSNPDWEQLLQIACLRSRPDDRESLTALGCDLNHVSVELTG